MPVSRRALVIGIDDYIHGFDRLSACVNDATQMAALLHSNGTAGAEQIFSVETRTSGPKGAPTTSVLRDDLDWLFSGHAEIALLYFAGHGVVGEDGACHLITADAEGAEDGISLEYILSLANAAGAEHRIGSCVVILDCCFAGAAGEVAELRLEGRAVIGEGVTIMTSCGRTQTAQELGDHGLVTGLLIDGLKGGAADICGRITPASLYAFVDQTLGDHRQRPLFKSNVDRFVVLREIDPRIPLRVLRMLQTWFKTPFAPYKLDPRYEPDRGEEAGRLAHIPVCEDLVAIYRDLQLCNRQGLVSAHPPEPHGSNMWHAAIYKGVCRLTDVGRHYRRLAKLGLLGGGIPELKLDDVLLERPNASV